MRAAAGERARRGGRRRAPWRGRWSTAARPPPLAAVDPAGAREAGRIPVGVPAHALVVVGEGVRRRRPHAGGPEELGDAVMLGRRQADVDVGVERRRRPGRAARPRATRRSRAAHDLADQEAEGVDVVAVRARRASTTAPAPPAPRSCACQSSMAPSGSGARSAGRPARWLSTWRRVMASLPAAANAGQ